MFRRAATFKRLAALLALLLLAGGAASLIARAHLTGAFSTYLAAVYNEDTVQGLKDELANTRAEIAALTPRLEEMEGQFVADRRVAGDRLLEWAYSGLDLWASLAGASASAADVAASQWLIERELGREMDRLDRLYLQYLQLGLTKEALAGHQYLLEIIAANLAMREPYLASMGEIDLETQAYYLDIDWVAEVEDELIEALEADRELVAAGWRDWMTVSELNGAFILKQDWLNERSGLHYHFRPDHIYAVFDNDFANVIITAQMLRGESDTFEFVIEGAFFNGFMVPEPALEELRGFALPIDQLREATGGGKRGYVEQAGGMLIWTTND